MREHPIATVARFYVACLIAVALAIHTPEFGLIVLGTNCFGWWGNTGCCNVNCSAFCAVPLTSISFTVSGVTNISCGGSFCTALNRTAVLTQVGTTCQWSKTFGATCNADSTIANYTVTFQDDGAGHTNMHSECFDTIAGNSFMGAATLNSDLGSYPATCTGLTIGPTAPGSHTNIGCDFSSLNFTIVTT